MQGEKENTRSAGFVFLLGLAIIIYYPALSSGFQLDDVNNLGGLGAVADNGILPFILGGDAGPSGRPLSLLSFALQHDAWPGNSFAFKAVNLAIHLACGCLIFLICRLLAARLDLHAVDGLTFSLAVTALWLLHPMQLSTVLYVIQRMTQLATLFTLLGIYGYLRLLDSYLENKSTRYLAGMGLVVWCSIVLGVLSKENGILLPLFLLVISYTLPADGSGDRHLRGCNLLVLGLPLLALLFYLVTNFGPVLTSYDLRSFSMTERLMSEAVVLLEYLQHILFPWPGVYSTYHDDFPVSRGLLTPPWTLVCVIIIACLLVSAVLLRKKLPVFSFAVLWFFGGHVLESTYLNLELYFEHRNYLPSLAVIILIVYAAIAAGRNYHIRKLAHGALLGYLVLVIAVTAQEVKSWANPVKRHMALYQEHPDSVRTVTALGNLLISRYETDQAEQLFRELADKNPDDIYPHIKLLAIAGCVQNREISNAEWQEVINRAEYADKSDFGVLEELALIVSAVSENDCKTIDLNNLTRLVVTLAFNPDFRNERAALHELAARLGIITGEAGVAYHNINAAVKYSPAIPRLLLKLRILIALDYTQEAGEVLHVLRKQLDEDIRNRIIYADRFEELQDKLEKK